MTNFLTISDASRTFGKSRTWIRQQIDKSTIPAYVQGKRIFFKKEDLEPLLLPKRITIHSK
jgi:hypothetical protein